MSWIISTSGARRVAKQVKDMVRRAGFPVARRVWNHLPEGLHHPRLAQVGIALTRICNADCTFCAYQLLPDAERIHMPDALFRKVVAEIAELGIDHVHLSPNLGDPLVAPRVLDKIADLRAAGVRFINLTTNGILLDKVGIRAILDDGPDLLAISTSAFDEAMYRRLYRSNQYRRMRANVLALLRENAARPLERRRYLSIRIRADVPRDEFMKLPDMPEIVRLASDVTYNELYGDWGGVIQPEMLTGSMRFREPIPHADRPCSLLYHLAIHPDGEILACACQNIHHDEKMSLGSLHEIDLGTAWRRLARVTTAWKRGDMPDTCTRCSMYNDPAAAWPGLGRSALIQLGLPRRLLGASHSG